MKITGIHYLGTLEYPFAEEFPAGSYVEWTRGELSVFGTTGTPVGGIGRVVQFKVEAS